MDHPDLVKLIEEADAAHDQDIKRLRRAFNAGLKVGQHGERDRIAGALGLTPAGVASAEIVPAAPKPSGNGAKSATTDYGAISGLCKRALVELRYSDGVDADRALTFCQENGAPRVTIIQMRTSLKVLARTGYAKRLERGKYAPGPKLLAAPSAQAH
jgi:hypothetical protein